MFSSITCSGLVFMIGEAISQYQDAGGFSILLVEVRLIGFAARRSVVKANGGTSMASNAFASGAVLAI